MTTEARPAPEEEGIGAAQRVNPIRAGFRTITPYIIVKGSAELLSFMKAAFGAEEKFRVPGTEGRLMHAEARIGDSMIELADANPQYPAMPAAIHLYVEDVDIVYRRALDAGAKSLSAPSDQPFGDRSSAVADPFGNYWFIATHFKDVI
jgi:PhnB protein